MSYETTLAQAFSQMKQQLREELKAELQRELNISLGKRLNFQEALEYLDMSEHTLRRLCREQKIPHVPYGAEGSRNPRYKFYTTSLDRWTREQEAANYPAWQEVTT